MLFDTTVFDELEKMMCEHAPYLVIGETNDGDDKILAMTIDEAEAKRFISEVWPGKTAEVKEKYVRIWIAYQGRTTPFRYKSIDLCSRTSDIMKLWTELETFSNSEPSEERKFYE